jgi:hypothetical protein
MTPEKQGIDGLSSQYQVFQSLSPSYGLVVSRLGLTFGSALGMGKHMGTGTDL